MVPDTFQASSLNTQKLQQIEFPPEVGISHIEKLYIRRESEGDLPANVIPAGQTMDFCTYVNVINLDKWNKYCGLNNISLHIRAKGSFYIRTYRLGAQRKTRLTEQAYTAGEFTEIVIPLENHRGISGFDIHALAETEITDACWRGKSHQPANRPNVAIVICTFNREEYLYKTLGTLKRCLPENWGVFVIDNARSIPQGTFDKYDRRFRIIPNPNTGGSGGFARGIMEVINDEGWSHILLMDDDIILDPGVLDRTHHFLSLIKTGYENHFIAGAMLRLDQPTLQHEAGAHWTGIRVRPHHHNMHLDRPGDVVANEEESDYRHQYAAWWFCLIPAKSSYKDSLPFPFFVNGDDIEFSLRHSHGLIHLNGIFVWHEAFHLKYNAVKQHYISVRNGLVLNARYDFGVIKTLTGFTLRYLRQKLKANQLEVHLILTGVNDFLKGPDFFQSSDNPFARLDGKTAGDLKKSHKDGFFKTLFTLAANFNALKTGYQQMVLDEALWRRLNS